ncbi:3-deoxy-7-phosphoheptulonate synthase, partial [Vibrio harveyi]
RRDEIRRIDHRRMYQLGFN